MTPRRPLFLGAALLLLSVLLVTLGAALRGSLNPACAGRPYAEGCLQILPLALMGAALLLGLAGALLVAVWMGRRAAVGDEDEPGP